MPRNPFPGEVTAIEYRRELRRAPMPKFQPCKQELRHDD